MSRALSVVYVVSSLAVEGPLGGVARFVVELVRALDRTQVQPTVAALWDYGTPGEPRWRERLLAEDIPTFIGAPWDPARPYWSCVRALLGLHRSGIQTADILHSHGEFSDLAAWWLGRRLGVRALVRTVHNEIEWAKRPIWGRVFGSFLLPLVFHAEWGVSRQVVRRLNERWIARQMHKQAQVMYNALDFTRFDSLDQEAGRTLRAALNIPPQAFLVGNVGRLVPQKGHTVLLQALALLRTSWPQVHLVVAGDGPLADFLHRETTRLGLEDRVHWLGPRQDIEAVLAALDLFVSSSLWEGLPTVILEALAAQVPVVATRVSGSSELLGEGEYGILVPPGDAAALAQGMDQALRELGTWRSRTQAALPWLESTFSIRSVAHQHVQAYSALLSSL